MPYTLGQTLPPPNLPEIMKPGPSRWFALIARPQREAAAKAWLDRHGVYAFYPVTEHWTHVRGHAVKRYRKYLPGYVFAEFPGEPLWHNLWGPFLRDVMRMSNGTPGVLAPDTLARLFAMREVDEVLEAKRKAALAIHKGDRVRVRDGVYAGWEMEVVEISTSGKAKFRVTLLGEREVEIDVDRLKKVG